ncbi:MAG: YihY/virulence factor BrkB family protein [Trueperaceae bacterium]
MKEWARRALLFLHALWLKWGKDDVARLAAALAFFAALSIAPLLLIATAVAGALLERSAVQEELASRARQVAGPNVATAVESILSNVSLPDAGLMATIVAVAGFAFAGSNAFFQLQRALDEVWDIAPKPGQGFRYMLLDRFESFLTVFVAGLLLIASPALRIVTNVLEESLSRIAGASWFWSLLDILVTVGIFTVLFAFLFKVVPSATVTWGAAWVGSAVTAGLFTVGTTLMAFYLRNNATTSLYGAAGSLMALLLWIYVSSHILLIGAEVTQLYARIRGEPIQPHGYTTSSLSVQRRKRDRVDEIVRKLRSEERLARGPDPLEEVHRRDE